MNERRKAVRLGGLGGAAAVVLATASGSGCAGPPMRPERGKAVAGIAHRLVEEAQERADLRTMRVWVHEIHETRPESVGAHPAAAGHHSYDPISAELEHEFVVALSNRLNLIETQIERPRQAHGSDGGLRGLADAYGATHLLAGDYVLRGNEIVVSLRLIEARTLLILAAARGKVPLDELGNLARRGIGHGEDRPLPSRHPSEEAHGGGAAVE